ncbi:MAG TPA: phosphotransferase [Candidatus Saccharimonadia bacterium]|nr:phosphotransferase [Candidatus Saccharimonadia bacterium]
MSYHTGELFPGVLDSPGDYLADPAYSGPGDAVQLISRTFEVDDLDRDQSPEGPVGIDVEPYLDAKITTIIQMVLEWAKYHPEEYRNDPDRFAPHVNVTGENSLVLEIGSTGPIVKLTAGYKDTLFEALILRRLTLEKQKQQPPVEMPDFLLYKPEAPGMVQQLWQTRVGGRSLSEDDVRGFSRSEKRALGLSLGGIVAYLADVLPFEQYETILSQAGDPVLFDRAKLMEDRTYFQRIDDRHMTVGLQKVTSLKQRKMHPMLAETLQWLQEEYRTFKDSAQLKTPIIGHDDLRPANLTFKGPKSKRTVAGVFDFESMMPTDPERALRHIVVLGEEAINAAEEAYGRPLSRRKLSFWAIGQAATELAAYTRRAGTQKLIDKRVRDLKILQPDRDWLGMTSVG